MEGAAAPPIYSLLTAVTALGSFVKDNVDIGIQESGRAACVEVAEPM